MPPLAVEQEEGLLPPERGQCAEMPPGGLPCRFSVIRYAQKTSRHQLTQGGSRGLIGEPCSGELGPMALLGDLSFQAHPQPRRNEKWNPEAAPLGLSGLLPGSPAEGSWPSAAL